MPRQLHVVGLSADGRSLLLAAEPGAGRPSHEVTVDEQMARVLRGDPEVLGSDRPVMSVKEMQARLRAGETVDQVAVAAGVPVARVERWAGPVEGEIAAFLASARASRMQHPKLGRSRRTLFAAVARSVSHLEAARPETGQWSAYRLADAPWTARFSLVVRGRLRTADWQVEGDDCRPLDPAAAAWGLRRAGVAVVEGVPAEDGRARGRRAGPGHLCRAGQGDRLTEGRVRGLAARARGHH